ncbi:MAG: hypothetical protein NTV51_31990, partial [Verrucomicrobia bacterium]|nr:hypothetical protein [Verrucomicrobiota bacterium]
MGVFEIIGGACCALMIPLTVLGQMMAAKQAGNELSYALALPTLGIFFTLAIGLIWLGTGSIGAKRWARALLLCLGWIGLVVGLFSFVSVILTLGSMDQILQQQGRQLPPETIVFAKIFAALTVTVIYVVIPGTLVVFYRREDVRLTCETRNPAPSWTDRCPLPVLAMCLMQVFGAVCLLAMPRFGGTFPLAGFIVTGWTARLIWLGFAAVSLYAAWGFYHLRRRAWQIYLVLVVLSGASSILTSIRVDLMNYYRQIGMSQAQLAQLADSPLMQGSAFIWIS